MHDLPGGWRFVGDPANHKTRGEGSYVSVSLMLFSVNDDGTGGGYFTGNVPHPVDVIPSAQFPRSGKVGLVYLFSHLRI
jgi:hypothetical protein